MRRTYVYSRKATSQVAMLAWILDWEEKRMHKNKKAGKRSRKLLKWIQRYGGYWQLICTSDCDLDMAVTRNIIHSLAKSGLHEFIFVLLNVHREKEFIKNLSSHLSLDLMLEEIRHQDMDEIVRMLDENLR